MIIIRNPYVQVLGGIFWDIKATYEVPTQEGRPGDIRLVLPYPKGQPTFKDYVGPYREQYMDAMCTVTNNSSYPWTQVDNVLQSTNHNHSSSSTYKLTFKKAGVLTFEYNVSSEGSDPLTIKHNSTTLVSKGGTGNSYTAQTFTVAVNDTVEFTYKKDGSVHSGQDTAYIKDLWLEPEGGAADILGIPGIPDSVYDEFNTAWQEWHDGLPLPKLSDVEQVSIGTNLIEADGNVFGKNGIFLFSAFNSTLGTAEAQLFDNRTVGIEVYLSRSVVNIDGMQLICDVYVWDIKTKTWVKAQFQRLPLTLSDTLNIATWVSNGISAEDISVWDKLNLTETASTYKNTGAHAVEEQLSILSWVSNGLDVTQLNVWTKLNIADGGTITKNDNPTPF